MTAKRSGLWFDVGIKRYTTQPLSCSICMLLWFDVGIKRYTTIIPNRAAKVTLWFDVGIKRYTTNMFYDIVFLRCGLM